MRGLRNNIGATRLLNRFYLQKLKKHIIRDEAPPIVDLNFTFSCLPEAFTEVILLVLYDSAKEYLKEQKSYAHIHSY